MVAIVGPCLECLGRSWATIRTWWTRYWVVALLCFLLGGWYWKWGRATVMKESHVTGKAYLVKNQKGSSAVADRLAELESHSRRFLHAARQLHPDDDRLSNIRKRWNGTLSETPENAKDVAYSISKKSIFICVRAEDGVSIADFNTCIFVLIHELAHVATNNWGHTEEFWNNMQFLLEAAEAAGFYTYQNFGEKIETYCGRKLTLSPLTCLKQGQCRSQAPPAKPSEK